MTTEETKVPTKEELEEAQKQAMIHMVQIMDRYQQPHFTRAKMVEDKDLEFVLSEARVLHDLTIYPRGSYKVDMLCHNHISKEPFRFFVVSSGLIVINPVIVRNGSALQNHEEGCMLYPEQPMKKVTRFDNIKLSYQTVLQRDVEEEGVKKTLLFLAPRKTDSFSGEMAVMVQHVVELMNGSGVYDFERSALTCMCLGDKTYCPEFEEDNSLQIALLNGQNVGGEVESNIEHVPSVVKGSMPKDSPKRAINRKKRK